MQNITVNLWEQPRQLSSKVIIPWYIYIFPTPAETWVDKTIGTYSTTSIPLQPWIKLIEFDNHFTYTSVEFLDVHTNTPNTNTQISIVDAGNAYTAYFVIISDYSHFFNVTIKLNNAEGHSSYISIPLLECVVQRSYQLRTRLPYFMYWSMMPETQTHYSRLKGSGLMNKLHLHSTLASRRACAL